MDLGVKSWRLVPPAGGFPGIWSVLRELFFGTESRDSVEYLGSGTEALLKALCIGNGAVLSGAEARTVFLGAYNCPDIITAVLAAGCKPVLSDLNPETLELIPPNVVPENSTVILSNLYGVPQSVEPWRKLGVRIIDDACQGGLTIAPDGWVGERSGTIGVYSFGRGKAFSGVGGGMVFWGGRKPHWRAAHLPRTTPQVRRTPVRLWPSTEPINSFLKFILTTSFSHPLLYRIPASLPLLGLGETRVKQRVISREMNSIELAVACAAMADFKNSSRMKELETIRDRWGEALSGIKVSDIVANVSKTGANIRPIRYPILIDSRETRDKIIRSLISAGIGATPSYPKIISEFSEFNTLGLSADYPGARAVADRIITLPIHAGVTERDILKSCDIIRRYV